MIVIDRGHKRARAGGPLKWGKGGGAEEFLVVI